MKTRRFLALNVMAVAGMCLSAVPALASDIFYGQYDAVKGEASGPGYAFTKGIAFSYADAFNNNVNYQNQKVGVAFDFNNSQLVGASMAAGIAVAQNGRATINVVSAQNLLNLSNR